jgi:transcriptional regulator with XRE-family HTH domain
MSRKYWATAPVSQIELAKLSGLTRQALNDILHRRRGVSIRRAFVLERAASKLGLDIPWNAWACNRSTPHAAFY